MTEHEYACRRLYAVEQALRLMLAVVIELMPPHAADRINRIGWEWDKELDALDAEFKARAPAQEPGEQKGGEA